MTMDGLAPAQIVKLGEAGVKSKDDFADLATDELVEILGSESITTKTAEDLIMKARAAWFADEEEKVA
jgi:N utilization substance protein A